MKLKQELEARGFLHQYTHEELFDIYEKGGEKLYWGIDPSADSFQLGNFISLLNALNVMKRGNKLYLIVGGATGMIGNPTGKDAERNFLTAEQVEENARKIEAQIHVILKNVSDKIGVKLEVEVVNNLKFFKNLNVLDFMREVGKYMTVNWMMNKDIVKKRITDPDKSISYAEFSYMLIMGYDFYKLYTENGVRLEVGGSDEWDGILSGVELTGKKTGQTVYGMTNKLITDSTGRKFGKSEGNAIWLDPTKNSPYFVYQYLLNCSDEDVEKLLKLLTFMDLDEIEEITKKHLAEPELRYGQKQLANYTTEIIFGKKASNQAEMISDMLFGNKDKLEILKTLTKDDLEALAKETGSTNFTSGLIILDALINSGLASSRGDGRKLIEGGGIYLNETKVTDGFAEITDGDFINSAIILRKGKKNFKLVLR
ncbi:tyrosine--tRNA ligase [Candidatus Gracilibacteria bacterium]|nr:tyrosine--tRNA ligase [Candidatus Gracilibacteria bacterium]